MYEPGVKGQMQQMCSLEADMLTNQPSPNGYNVIRVRRPKLLFWTAFPIG